MNKVDPSNARSRDRFSVVPLVIVIVLVGVFFFSAYASNNFQQYGFLSFSSVLFAFIAAAVNLTLLIVRLASHRWRASMSVAVPLLVLIACFLARFEILFEIDRARSNLFRTHYVNALFAPTAQLDAKGLRIVHWGFWGHFLSGAFHRELVYDETDDVGHPDGMRSGRALEAIRSTVECGRSSKIVARQVEPHFYIVDIGCT